VKKLLVIEDDEALRGLYGEYLRAGGYTVVEASDAPVALQKALTEEWDAMLLDIDLPGGDGIEVLKMIKANERLRDKPIVTYADVDSELAINDIYEQGADGFLIKSEITADKLINEIETVLQKYS